MGETYQCAKIYSPPICLPPNPHRPIMALIQSMTTQRRNKYNNGKKQDLGHFTRKCLLLWSLSWSWQYAHFNFPQQQAGLGNQNSPTKAKFELSIHLQLLWGKIWPWSDGFGYLQLQHLHIVEAYINFTIFWSTIQMDPNDNSQWILTGQL